MTKDIVFLVADKDMEQTISGLLSRSQSLNIHNLDYDIYVHTQRDPGCWNEAPQFLRPYSRTYKHAIVLLDHDGSGQESKNIDELQNELENRLAQNGWDHRAKVIILKPELEIWVWSDSPQVAQCLGWSGQDPSLRSWLLENNMLIQNSNKPLKPKEAMEEALRKVRKPRSASLFKQLAQTVSFNRCTDLGFLRLKSTLSEWFSD